MRLFRQFFRIIQINMVLVRHGLEEVVFAIHLFRPIRFVLYLLPWHWFRDDDIPDGVRIRRVLEDLGPIFVKFGQALSTRRDLLPDEIRNQELPDAVAALVNNYKIKKGIKILFNSDDLPKMKIQNKKHIFRIIQELLNNGNQIEVEGRFQKKNLF